MNDLTVSGGNLTGAQDEGGGIFNEGNLTLNQCTVSNNSATYGGGVSNKSSLVVVDSDFHNNQATRGGGGLHNNEGSSSMTISGSTFRNNTVVDTGGFRHRRRVTERSEFRCGYSHQLHFQRQPGAGYDG